MFIDKVTSAYVLYISKILTIYTRSFLYLELEAGCYFIKIIIRKLSKLYLLVTLVK